MGLRPTAPFRLNPSQRALRTGFRPCSEMESQEHARSIDIRIRVDRAVRGIREDQKINQEEAAERCGRMRRRTAVTSSDS